MSVYCILQTSSIVKYRIKALYGPKSVVSLIYA